MKKSLLVVLVFFSALILGGCSIPFIGGSKKAALQITSNPKTTVFLNDERVGSTPYFSDTIKPAEYKVKLTPEDSSVQAISWEGRVELVGGVLTVISRDLGENEEKSSGYVLSLEPKTDKTKASLSVITNPDGSVVSVDGEPKGFAPLSVDDLQEDEHSLVISSPGFVEKSIKAKLVKGYELIAKVQLAKMPEDDSPTGEEEEEATESAEEDEDEEEEEAKPSPKASPKASPKTTTPDEELERPFVQIDSPDIGWVRVREDATTSSEELTKVNHGEQYPFIDSQSGWYKIEYETGEEGWISGKYAELYE